MHACPFYTYGDGDSLRYIEFAQVGGARTLTQLCPTPESTMPIPCHAAVTVNYWLSFMEIYIGKDMEIFNKIHMVLKEGYTRANIGEYCFVKFDAPSLMLTDGLSKQSTYNQFVNKVGIR